MKNAKIVYFDSFYTKVAIFYVSFNARSHVEGPLHVLRVL